MGVEKSEKDHELEGFHRYLEIEHRRDSIVDSLVTQLELLEARIALLEDHLAPPSSGWMAR